jgi:hypothetical protein
MSFGDLPCPDCQILKEPGRLQQGNQDHHPQKQAEGVEIHGSHGLGFRIEAEQLAQDDHQGCTGHANNHAVDLFGEDQSQADEEDQAGGNCRENHQLLR